MNKYQIINIIEEYFDKISEQYGESKYHITLPYLCIDDSPYSDAVDPTTIAVYDFSDNEIIVYWKNITSVEMLIRTLVHEYQHYLQSPSWFKRYYTMGHTYDSHPYEVQAWNEEQKWELFT